MLSAFFIYGCTFPVNIRLFVLQQAEIKQQSIASKTPPAECMNVDQDTFTWIKSYFTFQGDKCQEYNEHLMIDPLIKVPPTKVNI